MEAENVSENTDTQLVPEANLESSGDANHSTSAELDTAEKNANHSASAELDTEEDSATLFKETKLLRDTLELLLSKSSEQKKVCEQLSQENRYLQDYVENLMSSGGVLEK
ncbi:LAFE_0H09670g1_1 [Lachancea fermentati]|uniref:LAFE_0H09670g1_1 n=1 Tax=Lachancea fermentati TaxID=4955 RepID=A0A1G4MK54_LACFM|nr:LAFE_0H09670g1_1 [Lachancea fermentati]